MKWLVLLAFCLLIAGSVFLRMRNIRAENMPTQPSPFSHAVEGLVASAGGVYLSLVTLVSFLKIEIPEKIALFQVSLDPLATFSIGMAVIQPLIVKIISKE